MRARELATLLRLSLAPSLLADVVAGAALAAGGAGAIPVALARALPASLLLFVGGMALNARVDLAADRRTRPERPLPRGSVSPGLASVLAGGGLVLAPALAWLIGGPHRGSLALASLATAGAIGLYHTPLRRQPLLGPLVLGSIRGADLLLGALAVGGFSAVAGLAGAGALLYAAFVTGASLVAHQEDRAAGPGPGWVGSGVTVAVLAALAAPALGFVRSGSGPDLWTALGAVLALGHVGMLGPALRRVRQAAGTADVARLAGLLLSRMPVVAATLCLGSGEAPAAAVAVLCHAAIWLLVRYIPPT